ncbi:MAG TPA: right-handed parallel beta-helix repeat-containing protein, partial [Thermotogota bacterium]|nr:right-handed parallel beta-helix repeat-containing protein [Thermotogota bacterium]
PILVSATLTEHGTQVIATFDKTMKEPTLLQRSEFAVRADGITQTIVSLSRQIGNESAFVLALQTPISFDKQVTLTYLKGTVQAQNEAFLSSFVDAIVTNLSQTPVRLTYPAQDQTDVGINLTLQWEGATGAAGYRILFGDSPGSLIQQNVELVTDTWYTLREMLTLSTGYYWKIEAVAANGATVTSETRGFTTSDVLKPLPVSLWRNSAVIGQYETVGEAVAFAFHGDTIAIERGSTVVEPDTVYIPYGLTVTASPAFTETDRATLTGGGEYGVLFFGKLEWFLFPTIARDTFGNLEAFKRSDLPKVRSGEYAYGARNLNIVGSDGITGITVTNPPVIPSPQKDGARAVGIPAYLYHIDISGCRNLIFSTISAFFSSVYAENLYLHHNDGGIGVAFGELLLTDSRITDNGIESENLGVGAVSALLSTVSIVRSTLSRNYADIEGAGFCAEMSQFAIDSCEIEENITPSFGSGICIVESRGTIIDSTINRNESEEEGGGLYVATSVVNIINSEFSENTALTSGSGLFLMGVEATLSSLTVDQNECAEKGGGIYCEHATLSVLDTVLSGNKASLGGGFYGFSATVTIHEGSIITVNETNKTGILDSLGGGIYLSGSSVLIEDATLTSNTCRSNDFVRGGGVYAEDSELVIRRAEIKENALESLGGYGAGVYCTSSGLAVENSLIAANTNLGCTDEAYGGGVGISNSDAWISDTSITGNSARTAGGGLYADDAGLILTRCAISENQVNETDATTGDADGGGVYAVDTDATITESQISENRLYGEFGDGAGLFSESSDITIEDSTITENEANAASSNGGGILAHISSEIILFSTLIASNTATEEGGGIWIQMGSVLDTARDPGNVSIAFNSAGTAGGGIYFQGTELYTNVSNPWNSGTPFSRSDDFFVLLGDGSIQDTWDENSKGTLVRGNTAPANAQIDWSN